jgi:hypothetical protein
MASYIELDKSTTLPSASAAGRIILGVSLEGTVTTTDHVGNTTPIAGVVDSTYAEISASMSAGTLNPGTLYKITNATTSSAATCLQEGGVNIILQAVTTSSLSTIGVGLFWVPNYENPNVPTAAPDTNYCVWTDTARLQLDGISGHFEYNEYVNFYSSATGHSASAYVQGMPTSNWVTIRYEDTASAQFFANHANFTGLSMTGSNSYESGSVIGYDYTSSYAIGDKVIWGGRVWQNLSGSIGYGYGMGPSDPNYSARLNPEDWAVVAYNDTDYTLIANEIKYEFEFDNISYRADATNKVTCEAVYIGYSMFGINTIKYFPWGNYGVLDNTIQNTFLTNFVNYPHNSLASNLLFKDNSTLNANYWGRQMALVNIEADLNAGMYDCTFAYGATLYDIKLGVEAEMYNIITSEDINIEHIVIGSTASFGHIRMYQGTYIGQVQIGANSRFTNMYLYDYVNIYDVSVGIDSALRCIYLNDYSEIKYISIGNYSIIEYFNLDYSSCLKRTSLANNCTIDWGYIGVNSFFRQITLSDRAYITNSGIGNYSNFQNINLGAYAYINNVDLGNSSDFENIQIGPASYISNMPTSGSSIYIGDISLAPDCYINNITLSSSAEMYDISMLTYSSIDSVTLQPNASIYYVQLGVDSGFGSLTVSQSIEINDIELGQNFGFGGIGLISQNISNRTIARGFNNIAVNTEFQPTLGYTGSVDNTNYQADATLLNIGQSFYIIDTTGWDANASDLNYYLPNGTYEGQKVELVVTPGGTNLYTNAGRIHIWLNSLRDPAQIGAVGTQVPWYAFTHPNNTYQSWRYDNPKATWVDGAWTIDNYQWD